MAVTVANGTVTAEGGAFRLAGGAALVEVAELVLWYVELFM